MSDITTKLEHLQASATAFTTEAVQEIDSLRRAIRALLPYAERFADMNDEPADGDCIASINAARKLLR